MTADETPTPPPPCERCARWRKLVVYAFAAIDADPREASAILAEAATELDGAIDELDAAA